MRTGVRWGAPVASVSVALATSAAANLPPYVTPTIDISQRMPTATDDSIHGEPVGSFWLYNGVLYQSILDTAGNAVWQRMVSQSPYSATAAAWSDAWGTRRLAQSYTAGKLFDLTRVSDSKVLTVSAVGDAADAGSADVFCAATTCRYTQLYDQVGSTNLTIPVATAPAYVTGMFVGNAPSIVFDVDQFGAGLSPGQASEAIPIPAAITTSAGAVSWAFVDRYTNDGFDIPFVDLYANSTGDTWLSCNVINGLYVGYINTLAATSKMDCPINSSFSAFSMSGSATIAAIDDRQFTAATGGYAGYTYAGGQIGMGRGNAGTGTGNMEISAIFFRSAASTPADLTNTDAAVDLGFSITPQKEAQVTEYGDSIDAGVGASYLQTGPRQMANLIHGPVRLTESGYSGTTKAALAGNLPAWATSQYDPHARQNVWLGESGTNDLAGTTTDVQLEALEKQEAAAVEAVGFRFIAMTLSPRLGFTAGQDGYRKSYNDWLRTNWPSFAAGLDDVDANIEVHNDMGDTWFSPDTTHFTARGYLAHATTDAEAVDAQLGH